MKKIILLLILSFILNSCSMEDSSPEVSYELLPIKSCSMPYFFISGQTYELEMFYVQPSSCHIYKGIYFEKEGNTRIVAIQASVIASSSCVTNPADSTGTNSEIEQSVKFNFTATGNEAYLFKFWTGKNQQGEDTYYEVEVPVEN